MVSSKGRDVLLGRRGEVLSRCGLERGLENPNLSLTGNHHHNFQILRTMSCKRAAKRALRLDGIQDQFSIIANSSQIITHEKSRCGTGCVDRIGYI